MAAVLALIPVREHMCAGKFRIFAAQVDQREAQPLVVLVPRQRHVRARTLGADHVMRHVERDRPGGIVHRHDDRHAILARRLALCRRPAAPTFPRAVDKVLLGEARFIV